MKKFTKLGILLGLCILLSNCDSMQDATQEEVRQENIMTKISFDEFKSKASLNGKAKSLIGFFDVNKSSLKSGNNFKNAQGFEDATIVTESIIKIKQDDFTTYTFTILTQVEKNEFYNLVLYVNENQEIYKSHILKYTPSEKWLSDRTQDFSGRVKIISNDVFDVKNLLQSKTSSSAKTTYLDNCIDNVYITYACSNNRTGHREDPRAEDCDATEFYYYINITYVPCSGTSGNDGGNFDPNTSGGTTTSGGGTSGIVTAPNTIPYTSQFKSFESGTLNATERTYYQGNSNIRNTIDTYLINYSFSNSAKLDSKSALAFSSIYKLDFPQFNWVFNNRASEDLQELKSFVVEMTDTTAKIEAFVQQCTTKMSQNPTVFKSIKPLLIETQIDDTQLNPCAKGVFTTVKNTTVCDIAQILAKLDNDGTVSVYNTTIKSAVAPSLRPAQTIRDSAYNYTIYISTDYTGKTKLFIAASMLHEMVHAYFMSLFDDYSANPPNLNAYSEFAILYQKFVDKKYPGSRDEAHHAQMAIDYVNAIAASLQEFQPGLPQQVYEDLAWGGLQEAPIFDTLFPVGSSERLRIINRYTCESVGTAYGSGTPQAQIPVGQPCNN